MPDQKFSIDSMQKRIQVYRILSSYYLDGIRGLDEKNLMALKKSVPVENDNAMVGASKINDSFPMSSSDLDEAVYEYNRLFIGPEKTITHPYESVYRNSNKLLMQKETLAVRRFYGILGIANKQNGSQPDDHLGLELEFMCYLLYRAIQEPNLTEEYIEYYQEFLQQHVLKWVFAHCEDIIGNSKTSICLGMALLLKGMLEMEAKELEIETKKLDIDVVTELEGGESDERQMEII